MTIAYDITLTSPLHHGAGNAGNTAILRTQDIVTPEGRLAAVPYLSANSIRHQLREVLAWHAVTTLRIEDGTLTKGITDLLFSGGAITTTGAQVDLGQARSVEDVFPALGLLGYAAGSDIITSTLRVSHLHLLCTENLWRAPSRLLDLPQAAQPAGRFRGEEFGTRHDTAGGPVDRYIDMFAVSTGQTTQMIYDLQTLKPGSVMFGEITTTPAATDAHRRVLSAALTLLAPGGKVRLGAKTAVGFGEAQVTGWPSSTEDVAWWTEHLTDRRDDIISLWREVAA